MSNLSQHQSIAVSFYAVCDECNQSAPSGHDEPAALELAFFHDWLELDGVLVCPECQWKRIKPSDKAQLVVIVLE